VRVKAFDRFELFFKFIFVGLINTLFYYILYSLFILISNNYILAVILANLIGILFSFKTFGKYVFKNEDKKLLIRFLVVYGWNTVFNIVLIKLSIAFISNNLYISGILPMIIVAINSFLLNKYFVFYSLLFIIARD